MARSNKQLLGKWVNNEGDAVWVYKSGRSYWISHGMNEKLCHPSIRSVEDTKREIFLVFHVSVSQFQPVG